jgi:uncharacterized RDD family membrane protein YckC
MAQQYFVSTNGQQLGPFNFDELKEKNIDKETLIWTEGYVNWTKAGDIPLLRDILVATPPPLPNSEFKTSSNFSSPPLPSKGSVDKYFGYTLATRMDRFLAAAAEMIIVGFPVALLLSDTEYEAQVFFYLILSIILGAILYPKWGGNLGHKILGLQVISSDTGQIQSSAKEGALREGVKSIASFFFIPSVWLLWDDNSQNLYDKLVKTYVIKKK